MYIIELIGVNGTNSTVRKVFKSREKASAYAMTIKWIDRGIRKDPEEVGGWCVTEVEVID